MIFQISHVRHMLAVGMGHSALGKPLLVPAHGGLECERLSRQEHKITNCSCVLQIKPFKTELG